VIKNQKFQEVRMNKPDMLRIINPILFISAVIQILTGMALFFDLFISQAKIFETIANIHKYNGVIFALLVIIHLSLNWSWVRSQFFSSRAVGR